MHKKRLDVRNTIHPFIHVFIRKNVKIMYSVQCLAQTDVRMQYVGLV